MKREEILAAIEAEVFRLGALSEKTSEMLKTKRISHEAIGDASAKGRMRRSARFAALGLWDAMDQKEQARQALVRILSCGDRLDTPKSIDVIHKYHSAINAIASIEAKF